MAYKRKPTPGERLRARFLAFAEAQANYARALSGVAAALPSYDCDCCGRKCSRTHAVTAYGIDTIACDECAGYEPEAYGEAADPLLTKGGV